MPKRVPKYCRQKNRNRPDLAYVNLDGQRHYLGAYGSSESEESYRRLIARWLAAAPAEPPGDMTVSQLMAAYWKHVESYYVTPDGQPTSSQTRIKESLRPLRQLYGSTPAEVFGPLDLQAVRQTWISADCCRKTVNDRTYEVRRVFKWAAAQQLIPGRVAHDLQTVEGLRYGRQGVRESTPRRPVPQPHIDAVLPHVSRQVAAMVQIQLHTGARPSEVAAMRPMDLDRSGEVWLYKPESHKSTWRRHERVLYLGPKCQAIIEPFLNRAPHLPLFSPAEAEAERLEQRHAQRTTPLHHGNAPGTNKRQKRQRPPSDKYTATAYGRAVNRACTAAGVPSWSPYQLRHNTATDLRRDYGIDVAQVMLGHRIGSAITEIYAHEHRAKALEVAAAIG